LDDIAIVDMAGNNVGCYDSLTFQKNIFLKRFNEEGDSNPYIVSSIKIKDRIFMSFSDKTLSVVKLS
jgi:hypothetical protein